MATIWEVKVIIQTEYKDTGEEKFEFMMGKGEGVLNEEEVVNELVKKIRYVANLVQKGIRLFWTQRNSIDEGNVILGYDSNVHSQQVFKFICFDTWAESVGEKLLIIAGPITCYKDHEYLYTAILNTLKSQITKLSRYDFTNYKMIGAGAVESNMVVSWSSVSFKIFTPESLRPEIVQALDLNKNL